MSEKDINSVRFADKNLFMFKDIQLDQHFLETKQNILDTILLYGKLDISGGFYLARNFLNRIPIIANNSEIYEEFIGEYISPFANHLNSFQVFYKNNLKLEIEDINEIQFSIVETIKNCGFEVSENFSNKVMEFLRLKIEHPEILGFLGYQEIQNIFHYWLSIWENSINTNLPLFSRYLSAPAWKSDFREDNKFKIIDILYEEVQWFPKPTTFKEAIDMAQDERIISLRNYISLLSNKIAIGELENLNEIKAQITKEVLHFKNKSWASKLSRFSTYSAIPVSFCEMLLDGTGFVGLGISGIGTLSQSACDIMDKNKERNWIALGQDFIKRPKK